MHCQRKNKIFNTLLKIFVLWAALVPASAQVYKWVDDTGKIHYGERPPQGQKAQEVGQRLANPAPRPDKAATSGPDWKEKELEFRRRRIESGQTEAKQEKRDAAKRQACNRARDQLAQMKTARRLYRLNDQGERVYQSDAERQASIAQSEQQLEQHCR